MQACGPVVRPHEILQTLIISIPQPSAAVKSFFELSRNFGAPEAMSALLLYRQQTADLPPIQRLAAVAHYPLFRAVRGLNERIPLLTPPHLPLDATPFGRASKSEGPTDAFGAPRVHH